MKKHPETSSDYRLDPNSHFFHVMQLLGYSEEDLEKEGVGESIAEGLWNRYISEEITYQEMWELAWEYVLKDEFLGRTIQDALDQRRRAISVSPSQKT